MSEKTEPNGSTEHPSIIPFPLSIHSFQEIKQEIKNEFQFPQLVEILTFFACGVLGKVIPKLFHVWESPIPYQETSSGDIILDLELNYPFNERETVPDWVVVVTCVILPILLYCFMGLLSGPTGDTHAILCTLFIAVGLSELITDLVKLYCGRFRPNFYNMCGFDSVTKECLVKDLHRLYDSRKSFPSGHASVSVTSMLVLSFYFAGKVGIQRSAPSVKVKLFYLAAWTPMLFALFVAASRVHDFYHHPADILGGSFIGGICAVMAHGMWYVIQLYKMVSQAFYTTFLPSCFH